MNYWSVRNRIREALVGRKTLHRTSSEFSGEIRVDQCGRERLLMIGGETHSIYLTSGDWREARQECWGRIASPPFRLPPGPVVLLLGLGGGTALHLLAATHRPARIIVIEADPEIVRVAREYFNIGAIGGLTVRTMDAMEGMAGLTAEGQAFDIVIDDVYFNATTTGAPPGSELYGALKRLVRPGGTAVFNRPLDEPRPYPEHGRFAAELRELGHEVASASVRRRWWNDIIYCRF